MLPVTKIFQSIQGEGAYIGTPCNFIRLAGCPIGCDFCDTDYGLNDTLTEPDIVSRLDKQLRVVVITGGEPAAFHLSELLRCCKKAGFQTHLETSGAYKLPTTYLDHVSCSPKKGAQLCVTQYYSEMKWLIPEWSIEEILMHLELADLHFLQPVNDRTTINQENMNHVLQLLLHSDHGSKFRLSPQLHKLVGVE